MKKVIIFGAATGGKFVANKLLNNEWQGGASMRYCFSWIMTLKSTALLFLYKGVITQ